MGEDLYQWWVAQFCGGECLAGRSRASPHAHFGFILRGTSSLSNNQLIKSDFPVQKLITSVHDSSKEAWSFRLSDSEFVDNHFIDHVDFEQNSLESYRCVSKPVYIFCALGQLLLRALKQNLIVTKNTVKPVLFLHP